MISMRLNMIVWIGFSLGSNFIAAGAHRNSRVFSEDSQCLTYKERYEQAYRPLPKEGLNQRHPHSKHVVLVKVHHDERGRIEDQILNLRSMAGEVTTAGNHFYILFEMPENWQGTRETLFSDYPADLHPYIVVHSLDDTRMKYPEIARAVDEGHSIVNAPPPATVYLAGTLFMQWYKAYDFAWVIEWDVRLIGHWGHFLNGALNLGHHAPKPDGSRVHPVKFKQARMEHQPMSDPDTMPDMISFDPYNVDVESAWAPTIVGMTIPLFLESGLMAWGGSRKLFGALHKYSLEGKAGYQSVFISSIAHLEGLKLVFADIRDQSEMYFCCSEKADEDYLAYFNNNTCLHTNLIHPIKNRGSWPLMVSS